jgi:hypothetical protein
MLAGLVIGNRLCFVTPTTLASLKLTGGSGSATSKSAGPFDPGGLRLSQRLRHVGVEKLLTARPGEEKVPTVFSFPEGDQIHFFFGFYEGLPQGCHEFGGPPAMFG